MHSVTWPTLHHGRSCPWHRNHGTGTGTGMPSRAALHVPTVHTQPVCVLQVFGQRHYWHAWLGPALLVGLSTVRYRSNENRLERSQLLSCRP